VLPPTPFDVTSPTVTGTETNGDYGGSKRLITNASLLCHAGTWKGDPVFVYDWSYTAAAGNQPATTDLGAGQGAEFPGDPSSNGWDPGGSKSTATCAVSAFDAFEGPSPVQPVSVTVPVAPPQPVRLTSPQIGLHVSPGSTNTCTSGTYRYLFGSGKFAYSWLLSNSPSAPTKVVGSKQTIKVDSSWLGKYLQCQVKVTPASLWKPLTEHSSGYVIRPQLTVLIPPSVIAKGDDPTSSAVATGLLNATIRASVVDMTCSHGGWSGGSGLTYKYEWVSDLGGSVRGDKLHFDMSAGEVQYDMSVRCEVTATASDGRTASVYSAAVTITAGCDEAIQETATLGDPNEGQLSTINDWAYYELGGHPGLAYTAAPASIGGATQVDTRDQRQNYGYATIDRYPVAIGLFGLKGTGAPGTSPWPFLGYLWQQIGITSQGAFGYTPDGQFAASHGTADLTGSNCGAYQHYLSAHGYHTRQVANFSALIPS
jgi:hypothetical protein